MKSFPRYDSYKDSGVEWIGEIPGHWEVKKVKYGSKINEKTLSENTPKNFKFEYIDIGSVSQNSIFEKQLMIFNNAPSRARRLAKLGDTIIATVRTYLKAIAYVSDSYQNCVFSTGFAILNPNESIDKHFFSFYLQSDSFVNSVVSESKGVNYPAITSSELGNLFLISAPISEQEYIKDFLMNKILEIDKTILKKQRLIELLKEQKEIIINQAVTRGLSSTDSGKVKMKDSGVEWIGDIPEHWKVKRGKFVFKEIDERSKTGKEELLSVSHMTGVTPRSEKNVNMFLSEDYSGSKICQKDDLVINIMWAWMGALGVSSVKGIVSPSYGVFRQIKKNTFNSWYLEHLLRSKIYVTEYNRRSTGIHSSRLRLYSDVFLNMLIVIPSIEEQNKIELEVKSSTGHIDAVIFNYEREIDLINEYKTVLISNAVTGKIKVG